MPQGDRTGPAGAGPKTGRGMGYCAGNNAPGWQAGQGRGFHRGFRCNGRGRGFMRRNDAQPATEQNETAKLREELEALRMQIIALGQQMAGNKV